MKVKETCRDLLSLFKNDMAQISVLIDGVDEELHLDSQHEGNPSNSRLQLFLAACNSFRGSANWKSWLVSRTLK